MQLGRFLKNPENWVIVFLGTFSTAFFVQTFGYRPMAALFPRIISAVLMALSFYRLGRNLFGSKILREMRKEEGVEGKKGLPWQWGLLFIFVYFGLINLVGFIGGTGLFLVIFPIVAGYRRWGIILLVAAGLVILTEVSLHLLLHVQFPAGLLFE